jgi:uncharacterized protein (DUF2267 family)
MNRKLPGKVADVIQIDGECLQFAGIVNEVPDTDVSQVQATFGSCDECEGASSAVISSAQDVSSALPEDISSALPEDISSAVAQDISSALPEDISSALPEDISSAVAQDISSAVAQDVSSALPEDISSAVAQAVSSALPEDGSSAVYQESTAASAKYCGPDGPEEAITPFVNGRLREMAVVNDRATLSIDRYTISGGSGTNVGKAVLQASNAAGTTFYAPRNFPPGNGFWPMQIATLGPTACKAGHCILATGRKFTGPVYQGRIKIADQLENFSTFTDVTPTVNPNNINANSIFSITRLADDRMLVMSDNNSTRQPWVSTDADATDWVGYGTTDTPSGNEALIAGWPCTATNGKFYRANNTSGTSWPNRTTGGVNFAPSIASKFAVYKLLEAGGFPAVLFAGASTKSAPSSLYYARALDAAGTTWGAPVQVVNGGAPTDPAYKASDSNDHADMCVDPGTGTIYARWVTGADGYDTILGTPTTTCYEKYPGYSYCYTNYPDQAWYIVVYGSQSSDNGATWSPYTWVHQLEIIDPSTPAGSNNNGTIGNRLFWSDVKCVFAGGQVHTAYSTREVIYPDNSNQHPDSLALFCNNVRLQYP